MNKKKFVLACLCFMLVSLAFGQENPIKVTYEINPAHDTILLSVSKDEAVKNGTLFIIASANDRTDKFFFPVMDTASLFAITIPDSLSIKTISLRGLYYPKILETKGEVVKRKNKKDIKAVLITNNKSIYSKVLKVSRANEFSLPGLVFEKKATLAFVYTDSTEKTLPYITLEQTPIESDFKKIVIDTTIRLIPDIDKNAEQVATSANQPKISSIDSGQSGKIKTMQTITVETKVKSKVEKFLEENSTPMFEDINEKVVDCLNNNEILTYPNCLAFLQSKIGGLRLTINDLGERSMQWRGSEVKSFFIDEMQVDIENFLGLSVTDIAVIKAFPPPFSGSSNGGGGAIAIYTRVGEYIRPGREAGKWLFKINGYSPAIHHLFETSL